MRPLRFISRLVHARRDRAEIEARYRNLVEQLPLITYMDSPRREQQTAAYVSPQIETILGYPLDEWQNDPDAFPKHLHPDDREHVLEAQKRARATGEPLDLEYRMIARDGRTVWLHDIYAVVRDEHGAPWYTQGFAVDVTERKRAEQDRERLLWQTSVQNEQLRRLDRMKDEFIALVSHELRTPLTSIRGYLELLTFDVAGAGTIRGDRRRVAQTFDNLLSNALKFTPTGGRVEVHAAQVGGVARIEVSDTGMGIAEEEQDAVFKRFFRTERAQNDAIVGAGLGLSIGKAIVEAHGGEIGLVSREGRGTTFTIELPAGRPEPVA